MSCWHANPPDRQVASGANRLILSGKHINDSNLHFLLSFSHSLLFCMLFKFSKINIALEFDTVGRSRLLYHGNGVVLIFISAAKPTLQAAILKSEVP
jgi:hypothetical protein